MKLRILIISSIVLAVVMGIAKIAVASSLSTSGISYGLLETQIQTLQKQNMILAEQLYTDTSLTEIASEAATLGFVPDGKVVAVDSSIPVAYAR